MDERASDQSSPARWLRGRLLGGVASLAPLSRHFSTLARVALSAALITSIGLLLTSGTPTPSRLTMEAPGNPATNISPNPDFLTLGDCTGTTGSENCANPCVNASPTWPTFTNAPACTAYVLAAINNARALESVAPMVLPTNWASLSVPEQLLVVTDLERVARGYPPYLGLNSALDRETTTAAMHESDPALAPGFAAGYDTLGMTGWGGSWSAGFSVLAGDYMMFYADGWGGALGTSNVACLSSGSPGCWAHRDELLGSAPHFNDGVGLWCVTCEMGAGYAVVHGVSSFTQLIELPAGKPPATVFSWKNELPYFAAGAFGSVKSVALARVSFVTSSLRVVWSVAGVQDASLAVIDTFAGGACARIGRVASFHYVATFNIRRSTVTISHARYFAPGARYSAVVRIYTPGGSLTSNCVELGRD